MFTVPLSFFLLTFPPLFSPIVRMGDGKSGLNWQFEDIYRSLENVLHNFKRFLRTNMWEESQLSD